MAAVNRVAVYRQHSAQHDAVIQSLVDAGLAGYFHNGEPSHCCTSKEVMGAGCSSSAGGSAHGTAAPLAKSGSSANGKSLTVTDTGATNAASAADASKTQDGTGRTLTVLHFNGQ